MSSSIQNIYSEKLAKFYVDSNSNLFLPLTDLNKIISFNQYGEKTDFEILCDKPYAIFGENDSNVLYIINREKGIFTYDKNNGNLISHLIPTDSFFQDPISLSITTDYIFVAYYKNDILNNVLSKIAIYKKNGALLSYIESCSHAIANPICIVSLPTIQNDLITFFVANNGKNLSKFTFHITKFNVSPIPLNMKDDIPDSNSNTINLEFLKIRDFVVDQNNFIYASSNSVNYIMIFDNSGEYIKDIHFGNLVPKHLFLKNDSIYFSDIRNTPNNIYHFDLEAKPILFPVKPITSSTSSKLTLTNNIVKTNSQENDATTIVSFDNALKYFFDKQSLYNSIHSIDNLYKGEISNFRKKSTLKFTYSNNTYSIEINPYLYFILVNQLHNLSYEELRKNKLISFNSIFVNSLKNILSFIDSNKDACNDFIQTHKEAFYFKYSITPSLSNYKSKKSITLSISNDIIPFIEFEKKTYMTSDFIKSYQPYLSKM